MMNCEQFAGFVMSYAEETNSSLSSNELIEIYNSAIKSCLK